MSPTEHARFAIALASLTLASCAPAIVNQQTEEQAVRSYSNEWQHGIAAHDFDRVVAIFAPDAVVITSHNPPARGQSAIRALVRGLLGMAGLSVTWVPARIEVASPTVAIEQGTYTFSLDGPGGKTDDAGSYINIWHKIDGKWRITFHATVTTRPLT